MIREIFKKYESVELTDSELSELKKFLNENKYAKYEQDFIFMLKILKPQFTLSIAAQKKKLKDLYSISSFFKNYNNGKSHIQQIHIKTADGKDLEINSRLYINEFMKEANSGIIKMFSRIGDPLPDGKVRKLPSMKDTNKIPAVQFLKFRHDRINEYLKNKLAISKVNDRKHLIGKLTSIVNNDWKKINNNISERKHFKNKLKHIT